MPAQERREAWDRSSGHVLSIGPPGARSTRPPALTNNEVLTARAGERPTLVTVTVAVAVEPGTAGGAETPTPRSAVGAVFSKS